MTGRSQSARMTPTVSHHSAATPDQHPWSARKHEDRAEGRSRTSYDVDRDRIVHSGTFRELQHKTQVQSIYRKLGVKSRWEASEAAHRLDLL